MKWFFIAIMCVFCSSCSIQFKGKDLEFDAKPAEPTVEWTMSRITLDPIEYFENGG